MSVIGPNAESDISQALEKFLDQSDQEGMSMAYQFLSRFKEENQLLFVNFLTQVLGNAEQSIQNRTLSALFIFRTLKRRTPQEQLEFNEVWHQQSFEFRESVRAASLAGAMSDDMSLSNNCASLLGLSFALEFFAIGRGTFFLQFFTERFNELLEIAASSSDIDERCTSFLALEYFGQYSLEFNFNCAHEQVYMRDIVPNLFECIMGGMVNGELPTVQEKAAKAMLSNILVFRRHISFPQNREALISVIFDFIGSDDLISETPQEWYFNIGYSLIRKVINFFYPYVEEFIEQFVAQTLQDLQCGNPERIMEACYAWLTIGEVESDIKFPERKQVNNQFHEYDQCLELSSGAFPDIFPSLIQLIMSTPEDETDANVSLDKNPHSAAFSCLSELSVAADQTALEPMFEFVKANIQDANWTLRYTSILLLNAASQLECFVDDAENIFTAFDLFVQVLEDEIPRNIEVAMWSLGRMIVRTPELITDDQERFEALTTVVSQKLEISSELTSRACWLYKCVFDSFSSGEEESLIALNFAQFSTLLLEAADVWTDQIDPLEAAYGALNKLIERTPAELVEQYAAFLEQVVVKLKELLDNAEIMRLPHSIHKALGLCSFIQVIVLNIGSVIEPSGEQIAELLLRALDVDDGGLVPQCLPALGAVVRAIGDKFSPYLEGIIPRIQEYLVEQETVQYAAVFVSDIYSSISGLPPEVTNDFVERLFRSFQIDDLSSDDRLNSFSALAEIAKQIGPDCFPWIDKFLELFERESKSALSVNDNQNEGDYVRNFAVAILQCYQSLVPLYATVEKGDRRVRNFFHIYDKLERALQLLDDEVLMEAVLLVNIIAETFGRKVNVYINKPVVMRILRDAKESDNPALIEAVDATLASISAC